MVSSSPTLQTAEGMALLLFAASLVGVIARRANLPYTVALLVCGIAIGATGVLHGVSLTPPVVLFVFLPGLLFEAAFHLHLELLRRSAGAVISLAGPGVLITLGMVAAAARLGLGMAWPSGLLLGAMVAATDPIAVLAVFRSLGVPRRLATIIEGESLFNDGVALVAFSVALSITTNGRFSPVGGVLAFLYAVVVGTAIGAALGFLASRLTAHVDDHLVEMTIAAALAYGSYLLAQIAGASGVLATIAAGLLLGNYGRAIGMSSRTQDALDDLWEYVAFLLNSLVFLLLGTALDLGRLGADAAAIGLAVVATTIGRALAVYGMGAIASLLGSAVTSLRWRHVIFWAGLRGALSLAMALSLPASIPGREALIDIVAGVVLVTVVVQGGTIGPIVRHADLSDGRMSPAASPPSP